MKKYLVSILLVLATAILVIVDNTIMSNEEFLSGMEGLVPWRC